MSPTPTWLTVVALIATPVLTGGLTWLVTRLIERARRSETIWSDVGKRRVNALLNVMEKVSAYECAVERLEAWRARERGQPSSAMPDEVALQSSALHRMVEEADNVLAPGRKIAFPLPQYEEAVARVEENRFSVGEPIYFVVFYVVALARLRETGGVPAHQVPELTRISAGFRHLIDALLPSIESPNSREGRKREAKFRKDYAELLIRVQSVGAPSPTSPPAT